ncbi:MAG: protoporphyrinogen oxidase [Verrucomicrobia bacterium]|nr:protoporphyrinogen oxidase [Verrucomicrobiota bacterium]
MKHVTIIGGGIAGLATAYYLQKQNGRIDYTLVEASARLGGKIISEQVDGFIIEGGPDSFITQKPYGLQLCRDLGIYERLIPCNESAQKVYLVRKGSLAPLPAGFRLAVPTQFIPFIKSPLLSPRGKVRAMLEPFVPGCRDDKDESIADFLRRRVGREVLENIGGPAMAGIYVGDPEKLSMLSTFPLFRQVEKKYGSLVRGFMRIKKKRAGRPAPPMFMSFPNGMQELVDALTASLSGEIRTNTGVTSIARSNNGYTVSGDNWSQQTDGIVLACSAGASAALLRSHDKELAGRLSEIKTVSTATVSMAFNDDDLSGAHPRDGFGFIAPKHEERSIIACTWSSTKFAPLRSPDGHTLLRVFVGGRDQEHLAELPDDKLIALARRELRDLMSIHASPLFTRIFRWPRGNPQFDVGHLDRVDEIEERLERLPGLHLAGSSYRGIGIPDCIHSGMEAAARLA